MAAPNLGQILATTLNAYVPRLTDQIFVGTKTLKAVTMKPGVKVKQDGGATIRVPVEYGINENVKGMGEFENYSTIPQQTFDTAEHEWKYIAGTIVFTDPEKTKNSGKHQIINLFKSKIENLEKSFRFMMNGFFFTGDGVKVPLGIQSAISTTGTYGGISRTGNTWWQGQVDDTAEVLTIAKMRSMFNDAHANSPSAPDLIVCHVDLYEYYEDLAQQHLQITQTKTADLGFEYLEFKGAKLFWDTDCPSGEMYFLNTSYIKVYCHPEYEWSMEEPIRPDQMLKIYPIHWHGNFIVTGPRYQGKLSNKTTA